MQLFGRAFLAIISVKHSGYFIRCPFVRTFHEMAVYILSSTNLFVTKSLGYSNRILSGVIQKTGLSVSKFMRMNVRKIIFLAEFSKPFIKRIRMDCSTIILGKTEAGFYPVVTAL
jgi:hypothetical protein